MNNGYPAGEVRPVIDRGPPNAAETQGASVGTRFGKASGAGSSHRCLACRSGTAHHRLSEAGNWGIPAYYPLAGAPARVLTPLLLPDSIESHDGRQPDRRGAPMLDREPLKRDPNAGHEPETIVRLNRRARHGLCRLASRAGTAHSRP